MERFAPKKLYLRIFAVVCLILTIMVVPYSLLLSRQFSGYANTEIQNLAADNVVQTRDSLEYILKKMKTYGLNMYEDIGIREWTTAATDEPRLQMQALLSLRHYLLTEPLIYNAFLINMRTERIMDYRSGVFRFENFPDQDMLNQVKDSSPLFLQYNNHYSGDQSYLSLIVPSTPSEETFFGYLVMLLNKEVLQNDILQIKSRASGLEIIVVDDNGHYILGGGNTEELSHLVESGGDENHKVISSAMRFQPWSVYQITPLTHWKGQIRTFQLKLITSSMALLCLLFVILFWGSKRTFKPISILAQRLLNTQPPVDQSQLLESTGQNEYKVIEQGIEMLESTVEQLTRFKHAHRNTIKEEYLQQWILHGRMDSNVRAYLERDGKSGLLRHNRLQMSVLCIDSYHDFLEKYSFLSRKLLKYALANIAEEILVENNFAVETVDFGGDHVVILTSHSERGDSSLNASLEKVLEKVDQLLQLDMSGAVSEPVELEDDMNAVYRQIYELSTLKFITSQDKIFRESDFMANMGRFSSDSESIPDRETLITSIRLGQIDQINRQLDRFFDYLSRQSYASCRLQLTFLFYTLLESFKSFSSIGEVGNLHNYLGRFATLRQARDELEREITHIMDSLRSLGNNPGKEEICANITDYVSRKLYDPMLNLDEVADHLSLSSAYVRQMFKEVFHMSLADYIVNQRIQFMQHELKETNDSVESIANRSGFQTRSHVYTVFKKATGMTPNQYRNFHNSSSK